MRKAKQKEIVVRFTPEGDALGRSRRVVLTVTERTTAAEVLQQLGLKRHGLLPGAQHPAVASAAGYSKLNWTRRTWRWPTPTLWQSPAQMPSEPAACWIGSWAC